MRANTPVQETRLTLQGIVQSGRASLDRRIEEHGHRLARLRELSARSAPVADLAAAAKLIVGDALEIVELVGGLAQADELVDRVFGRKSVGERLEKRA